MGWAPAASRRQCRGDAVLGGVAGVGDLFGPFWAKNGKLLSNIGRFIEGVCSKVVGYYVSATKSKGGGKDPMEEKYFRILRLLGTSYKARAEAEARTHQFAAAVHSVKPPDSYKEKDMRYKDEVIKLKPGKKDRLK
uniref:Uncharacterized protein n=1 Tax=Chenopodium quinoa TaxID=63459 RepID=A0A803L2T5_CHEQI